MSQFYDLARRAREVHDEEKARFEEANERNNRRLVTTNAHHDLIVALNELTQRLSREGYFGPLEGAELQSVVHKVTTAIMRLGERVKEAGYMPALNGEFPEWRLKNRFNEQINQPNGRPTLQCAWELLKAAWSQGDYEETDRQLALTATDDALRPVRLWLQILTGLVIESEGKWDSETIEFGAAPAPEPASALPAPLSPITTPADESPKLTPRQFEVLQALLILKALNPAVRKTAAEIAKKIEPDMSPVAIKEPMAALQKLGFVDTYRGRHGGCWLTEKGREYMRRLDQAEKVGKGRKQ
jgi:hypothetical protein